MPEQAFSTPETFTRLQPFFRKNETNGEHTAVVCLIKGVSPCVNCLQQC